MLSCVRALARVVSGPQPRCLCAPLDLFDHRPGRPGASTRRPDCPCHEPASPPVALNRGEHPLWDSSCLTRCPPGHGDAGREPLDVPLERTGKVSSKSLTSNACRRSGEANAPKFVRCASPHSCTLNPDWRGRQIGGHRRPRRDRRRTATRASGRNGSAPAAARGPCPAPARRSGPAVTARTPLRFQRGQRASVPPPGDPVCSGQSICLVRGPAGHPPAALASDCHGDPSSPLVLSAARCHR